MDVDEPFKKYQPQESRKIIFQFKKIKKTDFLDNFLLFLTPFWSYHLNHLSYRSETLTQNGRRLALKNCQLRESHKIIFSIKKIKNWFSGRFHTFWNTVSAISSKPFELQISNSYTKWTSMGLSKNVNHRNLTKLFFYLKKIENGFLWRFRTFWNTILAIFSKPFELQIWNSYTKWTSMGP